MLAELTPLRPIMRALRTRWRLWLPAAIVLLVALALWLWSCNG